MSSKLQIPHTQLQIPHTNTEPLSTVLSTLRLESTEEGSFIGKNLRQFQPRVYGGQVLAQAVVAAHATMTAEREAREIHSITGAFLRPGDIEVPTQFDVEDVLDGRSFSTRRIHASQHAQTIFSARASFQEPQRGVEHQSHAPQAPDPELLESSVDFFAAIDHPVARALSATNAIDMRHVDGAIWFKPQQEHRAHTLIWFKLRSPMPPESSQTLHRAMLAYATDQFMLEPIMRAHGVAWMDRGVALATLDHAIWWHRDVDMSQWVLAELDSPSAQGGRGLSIAKFFQGGAHVATMSQEGMIRVPEELLGSQTTSTAAKLDEPAVVSPGSQQL